MRWTALLLVALRGLAAGCGGAATSTSTPQTPAPTTGPAQPRAGRLLDRWSDTLLLTLVAARERGQAPQAGNRGDYDRADRLLRPGLRKVKGFAAQGRIVMSQFPPGALQRAVVDDGDAWQAWAIELLRPGEISMGQARHIADLATRAYVAHERAYRLAGKQPPPAFQRRPDQQ